MSGILEQLLAGSRAEGECLVWCGPTDTKGYGKLGHALVHRAAWIARHGEPPVDKPCVLHRCDNPPCWRDEHLWVGTKGDNNRDKIAKRRHWRPSATTSECLYGHPFTDANTYVRGTHRACRACNRQAQRERRMRRAAAETINV